MSRVACTSPGGRGTPGVGGEMQGYPQWRKHCYNFLSFIQAPLAKALPLQLETHQFLSIRISEPMILQILSSVFSEISLLVLALRGILANLFHTVRAALPIYIPTVSWRAPSVHQRHSTSKHHGPHHPDDIGGAPLPGCQCPCR